MAPPRPMLGHLLVSVIVVDGPAGSSAAFTPDEILSALRDLYTGTGLLRQIADTWATQQVTPNANICGFTVSSTTVTLGLDPAPLAAAPMTFDARQRVWAQEALDALGAPAGSSLEDRIKTLSTSLAAATFVGLSVSDAFFIFVTKYPCHHSACADDGAVYFSWPEVLAHAGGPPYRVFAHEIGHVFGAPDEYVQGATTCTVADVTGPFDTPNANCELIAPGQPNPATTACLMRGNDGVVCPSTVLHWGWRDADNDGEPDLFAPGILNPLDERAGSPGGVITLRGRNIWDTRVVFFGDVGTDQFSMRSFEELDVVIPSGVSGIVTISYLTRRGLVTGSFDDSWFLVAPSGTPVVGPNEPAIFGIMPTSGSAGTDVTILGANLFGPSSVSFGATVVDLSGMDPFQLGTENVLFLTVPAGPSGTVEVSVTSSDVTSAPFPPFSSFTYV